jgi:AcrR family transcriptional regulator
MNLQRARPAKAINPYYSMLRTIIEYRTLPPMPRKYDASRRLEAASRTREQILAAAFKLHGQGILDVESLAREANVSVATVRKHFPNREILFQGCTGYAMHLVPWPDLTMIAALADPAERTATAVAQLYRLLESLLGQTWGAYKLEDESAVMAATIRRSEGLCAAIADLIVAAWPLDPARAAGPRGLAAGLLSPLGYRALRTAGGLTPAQTTAQVTAALLHALQPATTAEEARAADHSP